MIYKGLNAGSNQYIDNWRKKMAEIVMYPVESSNVQEFGYDPEERVLAVRFLATATRPSSLYYYYEVEPATFERFLAAPSKGKFVWPNLRGRYDYERVGE